MITPKTFLIDFDGTVVGNSYPDVGPDVPNAVKVLKKLQKAGHTLILLTMREGHLLDDAENWFHVHEIEVKYSNCNPEFETGSRKVYGHYSIDDHNIGIPLMLDIETHHKPFVDWYIVEQMLIEKKLL